MSRPLAKPCRLLIVDDHALIRLGLRQLLAATPDIEIAGEAASGAEALRWLACNRADVVLLDLALPGRSGVEVLKRMRSATDAVPVLVYSRFPAEQYALRCLRAGAAGYVTKRETPAHLVEAVRRVAKGGRYLPRGLAVEVEAAAAVPAHGALSARELEVFRMLVGGLSVSRIAHELSLSVKTISTHRTRILHKLGLGSTAELVRYAIAHRLADDA